jgi:hypothetical protein
MKKEIQEVYINLDDSGKLTPKEKISVYGGLVFLSKKEKDKFITQYRSIIKDIKCSYCKEDCNSCSKQCPEIKNTNIRKNDKRRVMNYIKKYYVVALVIKNDKVYKNIKESKSAKGRFVDYSLRRMIKEIIKSLIKNNSINPNNPIRIIINIDQQTTKSNGYYNLHDGLVEELKYGISNYNYSSVINPIIFSDLTITVSYQDSRKSFVIQAADLLAGTIRRTTLANPKEIPESLSKFVDFEIIIP